MLLDAVAVDTGHSPWGDAHAEIAHLPELGWSVLIPFFNERHYLERTIASLARQDVPARLILIDNGSTDGSAAVARAACSRLGIACTLIEERRAGKVSALATGLAQVRTRYVATCDADTWYPSDYLAQAGRLLETDGCVAAGALFVGNGPDQKSLPEAARKMRIVAALFPQQCHSGGAGQVFHTVALRRAGGFDAARWNWVLEDHEVMHRIVQLGSIAYGPDFWCAPSPRERDRPSIRWNLVERMLYLLAPATMRDRFFYDFLADRLKARRLSSARIRERHFHDSFHDNGVLGDASAYPVRG